MSLANFASNYDLVIVIVGDNDAKYESKEFICQNFLDFRNSVWPTEVRFAGHMRRKDLPQELVSKNNMFYRNHLGSDLKSTRSIKREDFSDDQKYHFDKNGEGYRHMAAFIVSVIEDYFNSFLKI